MIYPELRHIRAFVTVAEELHFGRAARRLNIVQPALSVQIRNLEDMLGVQLLHRTRRSVALTEPGRLFLEEARRILGQVNRAVDVAQRAGRGEAGRLVVGYSAATAYSGLLSRTIGAFHQTAPAVVLSVREMHPALQRDALLAGELDIGFVVADAGSRSPDFESCIAERWAMAVALPSGHRLAGAVAVPLDALGEDLFVTYAANGEDLGVDAFHAAAGYAPTVGFHADNPVMLLSLVAAGLGFAVVPAVMQNAAIPGVVFRPAAQRMAELTVVALSRTGDHSPVLTRFKGLLATERV